MKTKKNLILVDYDCPREWKFVDGLSKSTNALWEVKKLISNNNHSGKLQNLIRYFKYFWLPFTIFIKRNKYEKIIGWQQFFGLILAFYCHLFNVNNYPDIYIMTFIYKRRSSAIGRIYENFIKYCVTSKAIKKLIVFSKAEPRYYSDIFGIDESLFVATELGIEDVSSKYEISDNGRYMSTGRSNRDYSFLVDNWIGKRKLDIICDTFFPNKNPNIRVYENVHGESFFKMLAMSHAVIISLEDENVSSGQLVVLQAMMLGKPVICTKNKTIENYIDNEKNGLIIEKNSYDLDKALKFVEEHYKELVVNAKNKFLNKYTEYQMGINIGLIIGE